MGRLPAGKGVVAFTGTAELIATSTNPGAVIRSASFANSPKAESAEEKAIISQDRCSGRRPQPVQGTDFLSTGSGLPITNESRFRQILSDVPGS